MNNDPTITVTFPDVDVPRAVDAIRAMNDLLDRLWTAGRLRQLVETPEGHEAVRTFTSIFLSAMRQLNEADGVGRTKVTVSVGVPAEARETVLAFARRIVSMMSDEATMRSIGAVPLDEADQGFITWFVQRAEGVLAAR